MDGHPEFSRTEPRGALFLVRLGFSEHGLYVKEESGGSDDVTA